MARLSGKTGSVQVYGATATGIKNWSLDHTFEMLDVTGFDSSGHRNYVAGIDDWKGSFSGFKDGAPIAIGTSGTIGLAESTDTTQVWTGTMLISGRHSTVAVDGLIEYSYAFQGSGLISPPTG